MPNLKAFECRTVSACLQKVFLDPAVDGSARRPFPALIVCQPIFQDDPTKFIDGILCHDVYWRQAEACDQLDTRERYWQAVAILDVLPNKLFQQLRLLGLAFVITEGESILYVVSSLLFAQFG